MDFKAEMEKLRLENEKLKSKPEAPQLIFGNTPATQGTPDLNFTLRILFLACWLSKQPGEKDCFIAKFLGQEPIPSDEGRMVVVVVSIEGISVLVPYTEVKNTNSLALVNALFSLWNCLAMLLGSCHCSSVEKSEELGR